MQNIHFAEHESMMTIPLDRFVQSPWKQTSEQGPSIKSIQLLDWEAQKHQCRPQHLMDNCGSNNFKPNTANPQARRNEIVAFNILPLNRKLSCKGEISRIRNENFKDTSNSKMSHARNHRHSGHSLTSSNRDSGRAPTKAARRTLVRVAPRGNKVASTAARYCFPVCVAGNSKTSWQNCKMDRQASLHSTFEQVLFVRFGLPKLDCELIHICHGNRRSMWDTSWK